MNRLAWAATTGLATLLTAVAIAACGSDSHPASSTETGPLRIVGGGTRQFRINGGDNTIESYGHEASRAELEQAATEVHAYLVARVDENWRDACVHLSGKLRHELEGDPAFSQQGKGSCAAILPTISFPLPGKTPVESTEVDAASLRVKGSYGFLFYDARIGGHKLLMVREGGSWKPNGLFPTPLH